MTEHQLYKGKSLTVLLHGNDKSFSIVLSLEEATLPKSTGMTTTDQPATQVFISYSHRDKQWLDRLNVHMTPIKRSHSFAIWDDTSIKPGMNWDEEIKTALRSIKVAVLLISADFLASEYIYNEELPRILEAAAEKGATILSVIVSPCLLSSVPSLAQIQSVNDPKTPLINLTDGMREELYVKVAGLVAETLSKQPAKAPLPVKAKNGMADTEAKEDLLAKMEAGIIGQIKKQMITLAGNAEGGRFLLVSIGEIYLQLAFFDETAEVLFEAVSNKFLPKESKLSSAQIEDLLSLGFHKPDKNSPNFYTNVDLDSDEVAEELAGITFDVLYNIHGLPLDVMPSFEFGCF